MGIRMSIQNPFRFIILGFMEEVNRYVIYILGFKFNISKQKYIKKKKKVKFNFFEKIIGCKNNLIRSEKIFYFMGFKFRKKIPGSVSVYKRYNKRIGKIGAEIVHIMAHNHFTRNFIDMVRKYDTKREHLFIVYQASIDETSAPIVSGKDIVTGNVYTLKLDMNKTKKIIMHGLLRPELYDWLYNHPEYLKITYWSIWSSDFYRFQSPKYNCVKQKVKAIITIWDKDEYLKKFGEKKCFPAYYLNPLAPYAENRRSLVEHDIKKPYIIQINQCATSETLRAIDDLSHFKDENIRIWTPVSYTRLGEKVEAKEIEKYGKKIFGNKFSIFSTYLSPKEYANKLAKNDIIIVNEKNQGGAGNLAYCMYLGCKAFINSKSSTYERFKKTKKIVFDSENIKNMNFNEFIEFSSQQKNHNYENIKEFFSPKYTFDFWEKVFSDKEG